MRIEIIERESKLKLEEAVNKFLKGYDDNQIVDIKYNGTGFTSGFGTHYYSAMIIIKENKHFK